MHEENETSVIGLLELAVESLMPLGKGSDHGQKIILGRNISSQKDRVYSVSIENGEQLNLRVTSTGEVRRAKLWKLEKVSIGEKNAHTHTYSHEYSPQLNQDSHESYEESVSMCESFTAEATRETNNLRF